MDGAVSFVRWLLATLLLAGGCAHAAREAPLRLAWRDGDGQLRAIVLDAQGRATGRFDADRPVPLGSLWKLVAYAQWLEAGVPAEPLRCTGADKEEVYCCAAGESIARGPALARSCGLFFARSRVPWDRPEGPLLRALPPSIAQAVRRGDLGPATQASPRAWLAWLAAWPAGLREQAELDLLGYWVNGAGQRALAPVASQLRVKTYTVERADGTRGAGGSGWTAEGLPVWFGADGTSADVVPMRARQVVAATRSASPVPQEALGGRACVRVRFFARYPIDRIEPRGQSAPPEPGPLRGHYLVRFANGNSLAIDAHGDLRLASDGTRPVLTGEFGLDDYVARVIDREAGPEPAQAAWALAIAARSHVLAHGIPGQGCVETEDATTAQRVAPRPPSEGALAAARATSGLVLAGGYAISGQYHRDQGRNGVLSWKGAREQAESGANWLEIVHGAYPRAILATAAEQGALACDPLPLVEGWIARERPRWKRELAGQPGFADPGALQVCRLAGGRAHARNGGQRIDVSGYDTLEERIAVAHEYVHLAFARHPAGRDENYVELQARRLLGVQP
jgi:uncharacterized protein YfaQ (DUF2300 family)